MLSVCRRATCEAPFAQAGVYAFVTSFVLYGYLIPISLYVSLEMVKVVQVRALRVWRMHASLLSSCSPPAQACLGAPPTAGKVPVLREHSTGQCSSCDADLAGKHAPGRSIGLLRGALCCA